MPDQPPASLADGYIKWLRGQLGSRLVYLVYANVVIFDTDGRVLAHRRYDFDWWSTTGGALELRESLAEAARREVFEETGLAVELGGLVGVYSHPRYNLHYPNGDDVQQWTACFWAEVPAGTVPQPDGGETLDLFFVEPEAFLPRSHPAHQDMVRDALRVRAGAAPRLEPVEALPPLEPHFPILRQHVGQAPIILPGATAIVEDDQGRILATLREDFHSWELPGGYADLGESSTANVVREIEEETGLVVEPTAIVGVYSEPQWFYGAFPNGDVVHGIDVTFACRVVGGELNPAGNDDESSAAAFLPVERLMAGAHFDATRRLLRDYADRSGWPHVR